MVYSKSVFIASHFVVWYTFKKQKGLVYMIDISQPHSIDTIKEVVSEVAEKHGVAKAYLFGSYARADARVDSDIDLRIDKGRLRGLFQLAGFQIELQDRLGVDVDVLTTQSLDESFLNNIRGEEVVLYEQ